MASIISSEVFRNRLLASGRRRIRYRYVFEDNQLVQEEFFIGPFHRPGDWDVNGNLSGYGDALLNDMRRGEIDRVLDLASTPLEQVKDIPAHQAAIFAMVDNPRWTIKKRMQKRLIYSLIRRHGSDFAVAIKLVWDDLPTDRAALKARLDLTNPMYDKLQAKIGEFYRSPSTNKPAYEIVRNSYADVYEWGDG